MRCPPLAATSQRPTFCLLLTCHPSQQSPKLQGKLFSDGKMFAMYLKAKHSSMRCIHSLWIHSLTPAFGNEMCPKGYVHSHQHLWARVYSFWKPIRLCCYDEYTPFLRAQLSWLLCVYQQHYHLLLLSQSHGMFQSISSHCAHLSWPPQDDPDGNFKIQWQELRWCLFHFSAAKWDLFWWHTVSERIDKSSYVSFMNIPIKTEKSVCNFLLPPYLRHLKAQMSFQIWILHAMAFSRQTMQHLIWLASTRLRPLGLSFAIAYLVHGHCNISIFAASRPVMHLQYTYLLCEYIVHRGLEASLQ